MIEIMSRMIIREMMALISIHFTTMAIYERNYDDDMMVTLRGWEAKMAGEGLLWGLRVVT